jgi:hypothetical protein
MLMRSPAERVQLPAELEGSLALVHEWLVKIAGGENPELDLRNLRAVLPPGRGADGKVFNRIANRAAECKPERIRPEQGRVGGAETPI